MVTLQNDKGYVQIDNDVFTTLTGNAAMSCFGVKGMVVRSVTDGLVHLLKHEFMGKGVKIIYNEDGSITIQLHIAVDRNINIPVVCRSIISEVRYKIEWATGVKVKAVDVFVESIIG